MSAIEKLPWEAENSESQSGELLLVSDTDAIKISISALLGLKKMGIPVADELLVSAETNTAHEDNVVYLEERHGAESANPILPQVEVVRSTPELVSPDAAKRALAQRDQLLVAAAQKGDPQAFDKLFNSYKSFIRLKASSYFLSGGSMDDVIQEGNLGFYKAVRDYDGVSSSFRTFAELCVTRQIITAVKTATRFKHEPLNAYVSFHHTPAGQEESDYTLGDTLPGPAVNDPLVKVISSEGLKSLVNILSTTLSPLESDALRLYLEGSSYQMMAKELGCDDKTIDNALQRVKRKILTFQEAENIKSQPFSSQTAVR